MSDKVELRFKYTADEYAAAVRLYMLRTPAIIVRLGLFLALFTLGIFTLLAAFDTDMLFPILGAMGIFAGLCAWLFFGLPRQRYRSDPKFQNDYALEFSDAGILFKTDHIDSQIEWSLYTGVLENDRFYLLVYGRHMMLVIPKRAFPGLHQESRFRDLLKRHLTPVSRSAWLKGGAAKESEGEYVPPTLGPPDWR